MARLSTGWVALPGADYCEAHVGEAMVVVESPAAVVDHGGPQRALYSGWDLCGSISLTMGRQA
jgi:hypothetical protein